MNANSRNSKRRPRRRKISADSMKNSPSKRSLTLRLSGNSVKNSRLKRNSLSLKNELLIRRSLNVLKSPLPPLKRMACTCTPRSMKTYISGWRTKSRNLLKNLLRNLKKTGLKVAPELLSKSLKRGQALASILTM